jgi:hypothetical protein
VEPEGKVCLGQREVGNVHLKGRFLGAGKLADNQSDAAKGWIVGAAQKQCASQTDIFIIQYCSTGICRTTEIHEWHENMQKRLER